MSETSFDHAIIDEYLSLFDTRGLVEPENIEKFGQVVRYLLLYASREQFANEDQDVVYRSGRLGWELRAIAFNFFRNYRISEKDAESGFAVANDLVPEIEEKFRIVHRHPERLPFFIAGFRDITVIDRYISDGIDPEMARRLEDG